MSSGSDISQSVSVSIRMNNCYQTNNYKIAACLIHLREREKSIESIKDPSVHTVQLNYSFNIENFRQFADIAKRLPRKEK